MLYSEHTQAKGRRRALIRRWFEEKWRRRWKKYQSNIRGTPSTAQTGEINKARIKIHDGLTKAESSLTTQIRREKIGFADFLHNIGVPTVASPACTCGWNRQTPKHVIMFCTNHARKDMLEACKSTDFKLITGKSRNLKIVTKWLMRTKLLSQYDIAVQQLDN